MKHESHRSQRSAWLAGHIGRVLHRRAEAGRAHQRAVAAAQTSLGDVVPPRVLEGLGQQVASGPRCPWCGPYGRPRPRPGPRLGRYRRHGAGRWGIWREQLGAGLGADLDHEAVTLVDESR